eukprot:m.249649 g.249649  ORF g.249649 m.249649 type:complete len:52 (-) comp17168_c0_seq8:505-660(-)
MRFTSSPSSHHISLFSHLLLPSEEHMRPSHGDYAALSSSSNNTGDVVIPLT